MHEAGPKPTVLKALKTPEMSGVPSQPLEASAHVIQALDRKDQRGAEKSMDDLVDAVNKDFASHNVPLTPKEYSSLHTKAKEMLGKAGKRTMETVFSPEMQKDLTEYQQLVADIESTYKFPTIAPEFYKAAGKISTNTVLER